VLQGLAVTSYVMYLSIVTSRTCSLLELGEDSRVLNNFPCFSSKKKSKMQTFLCFEYGYTQAGGITKKMIDSMNDKMDKKIGYII